MIELAKSIPIWVYIIVGILVVAAIVVAAIVLFSKKKKSAPRLPDGVEDMPAAVRATFAAADSVLHTRIADRVRAFVEGPAPVARDLERRLLVMGAKGSGKTALLRQLAKETTFAPPIAKAEGSPLNLFRLDGAIAIDVAGRVVADQDANGDGGEAFHAVFGELRRAFPERPVDGILLTISAAELLAPADDVPPPGGDPAAPGKPAPSGKLRAAPKSSDARDAAEAWARRLRRRIEQASRLLDMRVPVYVVITQCDRIPSFEAFCTEVGDQRRQRMLGWSNATAPFTGTGDAPPVEGADWVDEALSSVSEALREEQERRFAGEDAIGDARGYFLFPAAIAACGDALRWFIDPLFHDAASGAPPALRGLYFCGRASSEDAAPIAFAEDLVFKKVLAESNLARPSVTAERQRTRAIRALQIASAVVSVGWAIGLWISLAGVDRRSDTVLPFMHALSSDLVQIAGEGDTPNVRESRPRCIDLLDKLGSVETNRLRSFAVPTSLASRVDARMEDAVGAGYDYVILDAFRRAMGARDLVTPEPLPPAEALDLGATVPLEKTPEFQRAERWLVKLSAFEANVERYNKLVKLGEEGEGEKKAQDLADLSESLFEHKLDRAFFSNAKHFSGGLSHPVIAPSVDVGSLAPSTKKAADDVFEPLQKRALELSSDSAVRADLAALTKNFEAVEAGGPEYTTAALATLRAAIERAETDFARAGLAWVPGDAVPAPPELDRLLKLVEALKLLGPDAAVRLRSDHEGKFRKLQSALKRAEIPLSGPLLARKDGALEMKLAPTLLGMKAPIDALLHQSYMSGDEEPAVTLDLQDARVTWDVEQIKNLAKVVQEHETFVNDGGFKPYSDRVRITLTTLASRRLRARTLALVAKAARREVDAGGGRVPEGVLRADADNLALAGAPFREILAALGRAQIDDARDTVRAVVRAQGIRILKSAQHALESEALYRVKNGTFDWWNGESSPAFAAFEVDAAAQLTEYVAEQRTRVQAITKGAAEPVLSVLQSPEVDAQTEPVVIAWDAIATAQRDYEGKKAGNSVASLERFITVEMPAVTLDNCLAELDKAGSRGHSGDYFAERKRILRDVLRARCASLASEEMRDWYARLRREFQRQLADRFPFAASDAPEDARPDATRALLTDASEFRKRYRRLLEQRGDATSQQAVRFIDRLDRARTFLEPLWPQGTAGADGALEVGVELRANIARELRGNQIAEWTLRFAEETVTLGGAKSAAKWHIGDPVRVQLRWAKNSPDVPAATQGSHVGVQGRSVTYDHRGMWALLRLLASHESTLRDSESRTAGSHLLLFGVRTIPDSAGGFVDRTGTDAGAARVFIRLTISGAGKEKALRYPDFPTAADAVAL